MEFTLEQLNEKMKKSGGSLDLRGTNITALPEGLTVGGSLDLRGTNITADDRKKVKPMPSVIVKEGRFIWCDCKLTHIKKVKKVREFTLYVGKIPGHNVVSDGTNFAHCKSLRDGIADLAFKSAKDRGAEQFKGLDMDTPRTPEELVTMYRIITGACRQGSAHFVESLGELKQTYTIREAIELTAGQYGADRFKKFFE